MISAKFKCQICQKNRTYKPIDIEQRRLVCMACRKNYPESAARVIGEFSAMGCKVQPLGATR